MPDKVVVWRGGKARSADRQLLLKDLAGSREVAQLLTVDDVVTLTVPYCGQGKCKYM